MIGAMIASSPHLAPARLPIIQYAIVCMPSLLFAKYTIKLENAPHTAESAMPARSSFIEFERPPRFDMKSTASETPMPKRIADVAPSDAPEEMPNI